MVLSLFKRKEDITTIIPEQPQVITIWSPAGLSTAKFSLETGQALARYTSVVVAELPCLGIPRLGFISDILDRDNCMESALQELEKKGELNLSQLHVKSESLALLPASVYATPDYPIIDRLSIDTLIDFPIKFINAARQQGYNTIVFECQGQLTSPMTFFALKNSDYVFLLVSDAEDLPFTLINIKRLVQVFKFPLQRFYLTGKLDLLTLADIAVLQDDEGKVLGNIGVIAQQTNQLIETLWPGVIQQGPSIKAVKAPRFFQKNSSAINCQLNTKSEQDTQLVPELRKIRL